VYIDTKAVYVFAADGMTAGSILVFICIKNAEPFYLETYIRIE
jgi:hypothetical protein